MTQNQDRVQNEAGECTIVTNLVSRMKIPIMDMQPYDVIVIGGGHAGAWLSRKRRSFRVITSASRCGRMATHAGTHRRAGPHEDLALRPKT
jgi:hypothetical protein